MTKKAKTLRAAIVGFVGLLLIALIGCASMQDIATPCWIDEAAGVYADEPLTSLLPWTTVYDAERIARKIVFVHSFTQIEFDRLKADEVMNVDFILGNHNRHVADARELQTIVFDPTGPIGILLPTLLGGTLGALVIPRPGDEKKKA